MRKTIILYALSMAALVFLLKFIQYRFLIRDLSIEFYIGMIALLFTAMGLWAGMRFTKKQVELQPQISLGNSSLKVRQENFPIADQLGISKREFEVLELMALGLSNQEIADRLFLSLNTVKTHAANLFVKLDVSRRTQAVSRGRELGILH